jgi:hypothetical protein
MRMRTGPLYDTSMRAPTLDGPAHRFISWNVAGMRALMKKDAESLRRLVEAEQLDAVCLQVCGVLSVGAVSGDIVCLGEGQGAAGRQSSCVVLACMEPE